jgi:predicted nucleic acid-binding protein
MRVDYDKNQLAYALENALNERNEAREVVSRIEEILEDVSEAAMRIFAERIAELERERDEARHEINIIRNTLSKNGEAVGNGEHDFSIIEMVENLMQSKDYFIRKSDSLERERDEALMDRARGETATMTRNHYERILRERDEAREFSRINAKLEKSK